MAEIEKLEKEKKGLEDKVRSLSRILELTESRSRPMPQSETVQKKEHEMDDILDELKKGIKGIKKNIRESTAEPSEEMKRVLEALESKADEVGKIPDLEEKIKGLEQKLAKQGDGNPFGGFGFLEGEIAEGAPKDMMEFWRIVREHKDNTEVRLLDLGRRIENLKKSIGERNIKNLESMISSKEDILEKLIPQRVREEVDKILLSFSQEVSSINEMMEQLAREIRESNRQIANYVDAHRTMEDRMKDIESRVDDITRFNSFSTLLKSELRSSEQKPPISGQNQMQAYDSAPVAPGPQESRPRPIPSSPRPRPKPPASRKKTVHKPKPSPRKPATRRSAKANKPSRTAKGRKKPVRRARGSRRK